MSKITAEKIVDMQVRALIGEAYSHVAGGNAALKEARMNLPPVPMVEPRVEGELVAELVEHLKLARRAQNVADEHWLAAGGLLVRLKRCKPKQQTWPSYVREIADLSQERADELIRIYERRSTVERQREGTRERVRKHRKSVLRNTGNSAATSTTSADGMPTKEEAEKEYQQTLYDQGRMIWKAMNDDTQRKFFAYVRRNHVHDRAYPEAG